MYDIHDIIHVVMLFLSYIQYVHNVFSSIALHALEVAVFHGLLGHSQIIVVLGTTQWLQMAEFLRCNAKHDYNRTKDKGAIGFVLV